MPRFNRLWRSSPVWVLAAGASLLSLSTVAAQTPDAPPAVTQAPVDPPAHINFVDGAVVLERDGQADTAPLNMPLVAGDRVRTENGRVEILFADGSTLQLDVQSAVDFQSDELIRLRVGRVRLIIPGPSRSLAYRIDAPAGSALVHQPGDYRASLRKDRCDEIELAVLRGAADLVTDAGNTAVRAGERALACAGAAPSYAFAFNSASWDEFDRWSETRRDARMSASAQYLPDEVRPYSASLDQNGSWQYDTSYGYVWYPTVAPTWRPYYYGRWAPLPAYGWTWIGRDPWAWPTHHYGRWGFSANAWFWIPGRVWSPAWVSWAYAPGYVSWCPLGFNNHAIFSLDVAFGNGYSPWHGWSVVPQQRFGNGYVHAGGVPRAVPRTGFAYGRGAPTTRGAAVPRATAPIRSVGLAAAPRGSSAISTYRSASGTPVYTNLPRSQSRVGPSPSYVGTADPLPESRRTASPEAPGRTPAVPRGGQPAAPASSARIVPPAGAGPTAGTVAVPRNADRSGSIDRTPARTGVPQEGRPYAGRPGAIGVDRAPAPAPRGGVPDRAPAPSTEPRPPGAAPGVRAVPRGSESAPPPPASRPSAGGVEQRAPGAARPSAPPTAGGRAGRGGV